MTTKIKILCGFSLMVLLLAVLAGMSFDGSRKSAKNFSAYHTLTQADVNLSDMNTHLVSLMLDLYSYLHWEDPKFIKQAKESLAEIQQQSTDTLDVLRDPETRSRLEAIRSQAQNLEKLTEAVEQDLSVFRASYKNEVLPGEKAMITAIQTMAIQAHGAGNADALLTLIDLLDYFNDASSAMARYVNSRVDNDLADVRASVVAMSKEVSTLRGYMQSGEGLKIHFLQDGMKNLYALMDRMENLAKGTRRSFENIEKVLSKTTKDINALSESATQDRKNYASFINADNQDTMRISLIIGGMGLLLGIGCALYIILGMMRSLKELSLYAQAIANGNFDHPIKNKEKGEVGLVIASLKNIPVVLGSIIMETGKLAELVKTGELRRRIDTDDFKGAFADIGRSLNTVCDIYTDMIDAFPVPIMSCDRRHNILFLNTDGQKAFGGNLTGTFCHDQLKTCICSTENCLGKKAMEMDANISEEVVIYPKGVRQVVYVTAAPLHNSQGETVGYFEVLTDLTEIREKQQTMMRVAHEALEIASRLAASSEKLSVQVEQISRGAELQRTRVEATASAMTEMNATVLEVARSAGQASEQSERARDKANDGAQLVNQVVQAITAINRVANTLQNNMLELGEQAESIGGVMNVISDIADQTNLLALNAAIEAARAGEAGRGFAVVADEVRKLAEKTMSATHEVGSRIKAIQQSARVNIEEVGTAVSSINEATGLAQDSGKALSEIVSLSAANSNVVTSIATAAEEQSATSEEIHRAVDEINSIVGETTEGMMQSSAAVQELSLMAQELNHTMESLR